MFKTEQNRNDENYNQTGIAVKIPTKNDGVRVTVIMLRSITASLSWLPPVITVKQASKNNIVCPLSEQLRACSDILSNASSGRPYQLSFTALLWNMQEAARALRKCWETLDYVSFCSLLFFRALTASSMLYNKTKHGQDLSNELAFKIGKCALQDKTRKISRKKFSCLYS